MGSFIRFMRLHTLLSLFLLQKTVFRWGRLYRAPKNKRSVRKMWVRLYHTVACTCMCLHVVVFRVGDARSVGVGKLAPHGFRCPWLVSPHGSLDRLKAYALLSLHTLNSKKTDITGLQGSAGWRRVEQGIGMWGVLLSPITPSPTLSPIYDGLGVSVTSNITWFHLNHDMVSRRMYEYKLSFYGGHSITFTQIFQFLRQRQFYLRLRILS